MTEQTKPYVQSIDCGQSAYIVIDDNTVSPKFKTKDEGGEMVTAFLSKRRIDQATAHSLRTQLQGLGLPADESAFSRRMSRVEADVRRIAEADVETSYRHGLCMK